jgi:aminoglycoside phosphotransferase (APT) family kinase protein
MPGATAEDTWEHVPRAEQLAIARSLGTITAAIHRLPQQALAAVERRFGGRDEHIIAPERAKRVAEIEATDRLSVRQRDDLLRFLHEEAREHLDGLQKVAHFDLAHNHIYLSRATRAWQVAGIIDWAEAVLGPPEWDVVYLWHWTFTAIWHGRLTRDREAMRACLGTLFADHHPPERFARRCLAALLHTPSMSLLWPYFAARENGARDVVRDMTAYFFPSDVFGPPD